MYYYCSFIIIGLYIFWLAMGHTVYLVFSWYILYFFKFITLIQFANMEIPLLHQMNY